MSKKDMLSLGDIFGGMLNDVKKGIQKESVQDLKDNKPLKLQDGGPSEKGGYRKSLQDEVNALYGASTEEDNEEEVLDDEEIEDTEEDNEEVDETEESDEVEEVKESRKITKQLLNNHMKESYFDSIWKKVIKENNFGGMYGQEDAEDDIDALGLGDATPDSDLGSDFGDETDDVEGADTVTLTIDRATAQTLIDLLNGALGDDVGGEEDLDDEGSLDFGDEGGDDEGMNFDEDEETLGDAKGKQLQAKNNKVGGKVKASKGKASSDVTDDVGDDGDLGHAITTAKKPDMGVQNKVSNIKQGQDFFR